MDMDTILRCWKFQLDHGNKVLPVFAVLNEDGQIVTWSLNKREAKRLQHHSCPIVKLEYVT